MSLKEMVERVPLRFDFVGGMARKYFQEGFRALEVGANDGTFAKLFKSLGYHTTAFDIKDFSIMDTYKQYNPDRYIIGPEGFEVHDMPHDFEFVHIGQVLEHVPDPGGILYNASCYATGLVIVSVPNFPSRDHLRVYTKSEIMRLVGEYFWVAGCKVIKLPMIKTNFQKLQFIVVAHVRPKGV